MGLGANSLVPDGVAVTGALQVGSGVATVYNPTGANSTYTGTPVWAISATSFAGVAMVVQGSASSFSVFVWPAATTKDVFLLAPLGAGVSSLSSGLVLHSHCTQDGQVEVRWSNVSTLAQNQSAVTYKIARLQLFT